MKPIPLIRASIAVQVAAYAKRAGANANRLWTDAGLPGPPTGAPERLVPLPAALKLFEIAARALRRDDFGARCARHVGLEVLGPFGRALLRADTLHQAMQAAVDRVDAHNSGSRYWIVPGTASVRFRRRLRADSTTFRQADLFSVELMMQLVRRFADEHDWQPDLVELQSTGTSHASIRRALDLAPSCRVADGRPATGIRVPRALLARHLPDPPATRDGPDHWPGHAPPDDFAASVEIVVESMIPSRRGLLAATATAAGIEPRTLQRQLALSGRTFRDVVDRVRSRRATALLGEDGVRMLDVAHALGYSDPAHFSRAFRRWTSMTPLEYRRLRGTEARGGGPPRAGRSRWTSPRRPLQNRS